MEEGWIGRFGKLVGQSIDALKKALEIGFGIGRAKRLYGLIQFRELFKQLLFGLRHISLSEFGSMHEMVCALKTNRAKGRFAR